MHTILVIEDDSQTRTMLKEAVPQVKIIAMSGVRADRTGKLPVNGQDVWCRANIKKTN